MTVLRVALLGAGHISETHARAWRAAPGCRLVGAFDVEARSAAALVERHGLDAVFRSSSEAIEAADVVDVCTPPHTHAELIEEAATAGRHLLVEKPVVTSRAEWERLLPLLESGDRSLGVVHNLKFSGAVLRARRWLAEGRIGNLLRLRHDFLTHPATDRMLSGPHWSHSLPGGRWFETLPHALYLTHTLAGPLRLAAIAGLRTGSSPPGIAADEVDVSLVGDDCIASFSYSANCPANRRTLTLEGETGVLRVDVLADAVHLDRSRDSRWSRGLGPAPRQALGRMAGFFRDRAAYLASRARRITPHARMISAFARHLQDGAPHPTPLAEVDYVVRTCEQIGLGIDALSEVGRAPR